jgi:hypothetical protein
VPCYDDTSVLSISEQRVPLDDGDKDTLSSNLLYQCVLLLLFAFPLWIVQDSFCCLDFATTPMIDSRKSDNSARAVMGIEDDETCLPL